MSTRTRYFQLIVALFWLMACQQPQDSSVAEVLPSATVTGVADETAVTATPGNSPAWFTPPQFTDSDSLQILFDTTHDPNNFPPNAPIVIHFSQPMNGDIRNPLRFIPAIEGQFEWQENNTRLVFTPNQPMENDHTYMATLFSRNETATGEPVTGSNRWQLHTLALPLVKQIQPNTAELTDYYPTLKLLFSQPMNETAVSTALTIQPEIDYALSWDEALLTVEVLEPIAFGETYTLEIDETAVDEEGHPFGAPFTHVFQLADPISSIGWPTVQAPQSRVIIRWNYPLAQPAAGLIQLHPDVAGEWIWSEQNRQVAFQPAEPLPPQTEFAVSFQGQLRDTVGVPLPTPESFTFITPSAILRANPYTRSVPLFETIRIQFDRPMNQSSVEAAFATTPPLAGTFVWEDHEMTFVPDGGFLPANTEFTVTLAETAVSAINQPILTEPHEWTFKTAVFTALATFGEGPNAQVISAGGDRALQYQVNLDSNRPLTLNFALYQLDREPFIDLFAKEYQSLYWQQTPDPAFGLDGADQISSWQSETGPSLNEWSNIQETNIPADVPPGLYVLEISSGQINDQLFVIITDYAIVTKLREGELYAWVANFDNTPVPNLPVTLIARDGTIQATGQTNANGEVRLPFPAYVPATLPEGETIPVEEPANPFLLLAGSDDNVGIVGFTSFWGNSSWWWGGADGPVNSPDFTIYGYTERPIYRPGQTVFYKGIVRADDDAILEMVPAGMAVTARIRDSRNNVVQTFDLRTNSFGSVNGRFEIATGAMLGTYYVEFDVNGQILRQPFKVEDYRKPDYEVSVTTDQAIYLHNQPISVSVDSSYFFGEAVANSEVVIKQYELSQNYDWTGYPGDQVWSLLYESEQQGRTDENGRFSTDIRIDATNYNYDHIYYYGTNQFARSIGLEATVNDGSNQTVSGFAVVQVYNTAERIEVDTNGYLFDRGEAFDVALQVVDLNGRLLPNRSLTIKFSRYTPYYDQNRPSQKTATVSTGSSGQTRYTVEGLEPGYYELIITGRDANDREISSRTSVYILQEGEQGWPEYTLPIRLSMEENEVPVGETAVFTVESPIAGPALMTIERGSIRRSQLITLTPPLTTVELPILASDVPNIYVTISAWTPKTESDYDYLWNSLPDTKLVSNSLNISVPPTQKTLNVAITTNKTTYAPGEEATFTVRVTNQQGTPVSAELSLAMVDDAIFALSNPLAPPIVDGFYFERGLSVQTFHSMGLIRYLGGGGGGGGGGGPDVGNPRDEFADTAVWEPTLSTDFNGEATITVTLPDNLTRWRLTAKAATADTQVGETDAFITTTLPLQIRPLMPRILTAGDTLNLSALVHNNTDEPQTAAVSLVAPDADALTVTSSLTQTVTIPANSVRMVGWSAIADNAATVDILIAADSGTHSDAIRLPLTIQPLAIPTVETAVGDFTTQTSETVQIPANALSMSSVTIELSRSIAGNVLDGLADVTGYPYGCVEQTMSRALPNAVVGRALFQLGIENEALAADLPKQISSGIQRLYGFQHDDGGWGWWYDDSSQDYQTAWVLFGLATSAEAGYELDPGVLARGAAYLNGRLDDMDVLTRAFALYAMTLADQPNEAATRQLFEEHLDDLDPFATAALALTLNELGSRTDALTVLDRLDAMAEISANGRVSFPGTNYDGSYQQKTMASTTRNTGLALSALSRLQPGHPLEGGTVRWLMGQKRPFGWGTTNETAFAIIGLTDHLLASRFTESPIPTSYTVQLNGEPLAVGQLTANRPNATLTLEMGDLVAGNNVITLLQTGSPRLYYTINSRVYVAETEIPAAGSIGITRTYIDPTTNKPIETAVAGQLVRVSLTVSTSESASYVLIEDSLPGGLEALNERLNSTSHEASQYGPTYHWMEYGYNYKEIRGDRVTFFVTDLPTGRRTLTYYARATQTGVFTAMPTEAYAMYDLAIWGRSASYQLTVTAE